jgi:hypothetical protein
MARNGISSRNDFDAAMSRIKLILSIRRKTEIGGEKVADIRGEGLQPLAVEASMMEDVPFIGHVDARDRRKVMLSAGPRAVQAFLGGWAEEEGITDTYGDPARGFGGGTATHAIIGPNEVVACLVQALQAVSLPLSAREAKMFVDLIGQVGSDGPMARADWYRVPWEWVPENMGK